MISSKLRIGASVLVTAVSAKQFSPQSAGAAASHCGTHGNYFDGEAVAANYTNQFPTYIGAKDQMYTADANLCGDDNTLHNFSASWVAIGSNNGYGWAQIGYITTYISNSETKIFASQMWDGNPNHSKATVYGNQTYQGEQHYYSARYFSSSEKVGVFLDGGQFGQLSSFNPTATWTGPFLPVFFSETGFLEDDMPGISGNTASYYPTWALNASNGNWENTPAGLEQLDTPGSSNWSNAQPRSDELLVWTNTE